ncbi:MAG TPA: hypothetical protein PLH29_04000 [bacterium]|nr:hypothetical protein [bacterium]
MKKSILVALVSFFFVVIGSSSGIACWSEKKVLHLEQYALDGARLFCMHQAKAKNIAYAEQLRYQEMAEMIVNGQVTYASTYNPRIWLHVNQVWHLYLAGIELNEKLKREASAKAWKIEKIKKEVRVKANKKTT